MLVPIELDSDLSQHVISMLDGPQVEISSWKSRLGKLEAEHGAEVYRHLFYVLGHLDFQPEHAKIHWEGAEKIWVELSERSTRPIDVRLAVLSYLLQPQQKLRNPALLEVELLQKTEESAIRDALTELYNYRFFRERISQESERGRRFGDELSLLMIDVDDFKHFNDELGHLAGNEALKELAAVLVLSVRSMDVVSRYGGEEFTILLPSTARAGAMVAAEKVRAAVYDAGIGADSDQKPLSVSIGVASFLVDARDPDALIERADSALYAAKAAGKNCVRSFSNERREARRYEARIEGRLNVVGETKLPIATLDLSRGGLSFEIDEELVPGSAVQIELTLPGSEPELECTCRVVRVQESGSLFRVGARIVHLEKQQGYRLRQFLDQLEELPTPA